MKVKKRFLFELRNDLLLNGIDFSHMSDDALFQYLKGIMSDEDVKKLDKIQSIES